MARKIAALPPGSRITDYISIGVITRAFPPDKVNRVLEETGKKSRRQRDLPAHVVVYYVLALALFMQVSCREVLRCLLAGIEWLSSPGAAVRITGKSGISQARTRLGPEPLKELHGALVGPIAGRETKGAWGIAGGAWSPSTAAPWRSQTTEITRLPSGGRRPAGAGAATPRCASSPWWRMGPMSSSARR